MDQRKKPLLIYDGDCNFCRRWISRWRHVTQDRVDYAASQEVGDDFPEISPERFESSVQLVEPDGNLYEGAEAVFRTLAYASQKYWSLWMYRNVPGFSRMAEGFYRFVAENRRLFSILTRWLWGDHVEPSTYVISSRFFLKFLGVIYLIAFVSLGSQIDGLVGERGILPGAEFLNAVHDQIGSQGYRLLPSLFWLNADDLFLNAVWIAGACSSLLLLFGVLPAFNLVLLWIFYLSYLSICREFLGFQWDTLLLETGFLAIFLAPWRSTWRPTANTKPSPVILFLFRWLLFRLIFSSGLVKLASGDPSWKNLTALNFHYETQPLPTWIGWYAHQLPECFQMISVAGVFVIQLIIPFLIFFPRRLRFAACWILTGFQVLIILTGNYCFFNLITLALCFLLLDDSFLKRFVPEKFFLGKLEFHSPTTQGKLKSISVAVLACYVLFLGSIQLAEIITKRSVLSGTLRQVAGAIAPLRLVNRYGLFAVMTTVRHEIVIEGSDDLKTWSEYEFKWKPGDVKRPPAFVAPHQPRLDWQMWFAALGRLRDNPWLINFMARLLEGSPDVLELLDLNPFPERPPRYLRALLYDYRFTDLAEKKQEGRWWRRKLIRDYLPMMQLPSAS